MLATYSRGRLLSSIEFPTLATVWRRSGREHDETLLDLRLELEQLTLLLAELLVAGQQPLRRPDGLEGVLDQDEVTLGPTAIARGRLAASADTIGGLCRHVALSIAYRVSNPALPGLS